jgi:hypothetical protein
VLIEAEQGYLFSSVASKPHEVGFKLNGILLSTLKSPEGRKYAEPRDAFKRLMGDQSFPSAS